MSLQFSVVRAWARNGVCLEYIMGGALNPRLSSQEQGLGWGRTLLRAKEWNGIFSCEGRGRRKSFPGRENSLCEGPGLAKKELKVLCVATGKWRREGRTGDEAGAVSWAKAQGAWFFFLLIENYVKWFVFHSKDSGEPGESFELDTSEDFLKMAPAVVGKADRQIW